MSWLIVKNSDCRKYFCSEVLHPLELGNFRESDSSSC